MRSVHDLHVWTVTSGFGALAAHVVVAAGADRDLIRRRLELLLRERFGIEHTTLQMEEEAAQELLHVENAAARRDAGSCLRLLNFSSSWLPSCVARPSLGRPRANGQAGKELSGGSDVRRGPDRRRRRRLRPSRLRTRLRGLPSQPVWSAAARRPSRAPSRLAGPRWRLERRAATAVRQARARPVLAAVRPKAAVANADGGGDQGVGGTGPQSTGGSGETTGGSGGGGEKRRFHHGDQHLGRLRRRRWHQQQQRRRAAAVAAAQVAAVAASTTTSTSGEVTSTVNETVNQVDETVTGGALEETGVTEVTEEVVERRRRPRIDRRRSRSTKPSRRRRRRPRRLANNPGSCPPPPA